MSKSEFRVQPFIDHPVGRILLTGVLVASIAALVRSCSSSSQEPTAPPPAAKPAAEAPPAPSDGPAGAKSGTSPFPDVIGGINRFLGSVPEVLFGKPKPRPPEHTVRLTVGGQPWKQHMKPGEWSPWFEMGTAAKVQILVDGPGTATFAPWDGNDPNYPSIWRFYNHDGDGEMIATLQFAR